MDSGKGGVGRCFVEALPLLRAKAQAHPVFPVEQHRLAGVGAVEPAAGVGQEHHREFQTLGPVDGHNGDAAGPGRTGGGVLAGLAPGGLGGIDGPH